MEFKEFCKKYMRMCKSYENCEGCPRDGKGCLEFNMDMDTFEELENDVERWAEEHPQKTRFQDFMEKYPNAPICESGLPSACCASLGYCKSCDPVGNNCEVCWNIPLEDE